jgi:hypothetical protein
MQPANLAELEFKVTNRPTARIITERFREISRSKTHSKRHPDKGGNTETYQRLVGARNRLVSAAEAAAGGGGGAAAAGGGGGGNRTVRGKNSGSQWREPEFFTASGVRERPVIKIKKSTRVLTPEETQAMYNRMNRMAANKARREAEWQNLEREYAQRAELNAARQRSQAAIAREYREKDREFQLRQQAAADAYAKEMAASAAARKLAEEDAQDSARQARNNAMAGVDNGSGVFETVRTGLRKCFGPLCGTRRSRGGVRRRNRKTRKTSHKKY